MNCHQSTVLENVLVSLYDFDLRNGDLRESMLATGNPAKLEPLNVFVYWARLNKIVSVCSLSPTTNVI